MLKDTFGLLIMAILGEEWKILSYRIHYEFTDTQRSLMVQNIYIGHKVCMSLTSAISI
jgi:hypothetical protein